MRYAVPVYALRHDGYPHCGAAFLVESGGDTLLATAGHIPLMTRQPTKNWGAWPQTLFVGGLPVPLFSAGAPCFSYPDQVDHIGDLLLLPLPPEILGRSELSDFHRLNLNHVPAAGQAVTGYGYPERDTYPWPERRFRATVLGVSPPFVTFDHVPLPGFSGGPLIDSKGRFSGMMIGADPLGTAVGPETVAQVLQQSTSP